MTREHLMTRIEKTYETEIRRAAKQYAPKGTDWRDMYQTILIGVYDRVRRRKVKLRDYAAMKNTLNQRAIDASRKLLLYHQRHRHVEDADRRSSEPSIPEHMRIAELKTRLRRKLPALDARIVIELAFPSSRTRNLARHRPTRTGGRLRKVNRRGIPVVRRWHVAQLFGVSDARITAATRLAAEVVGYVIEEEGGASDKRIRGR